MDVNINNEKITNYKEFVKKVFYSQLFNSLNSTKLEVRLFNENIKSFFDANMILIDCGYKENQYTLTHYFEDDDSILDILAESRSFIKERVKSILDLILIEIKSKITKFNCKENELTLLLEDEQINCHPPHYTNPHYILTLGMSFKIILTNLLPSEEIKIFLLKDDPSKYVLENLPSYELKNNNFISEVEMKKSTFLSSCKGKLFEIEKSGIKETIMISFTDISLQYLAKNFNDKEIIEFYVNVINNFMKDFSIQNLYNENKTSKNELDYNGCFFSAGKIDKEYFENGEDEFGFLAKIYPVLIITSKYQLK
jgi:hypothetical protein